MKTLVQFVLAVSLLSFSLFSYAQTTYVWTGVSSTSYTDPLNWNPARTATSVSDELVFNNGATVEVTEVVTETIGSLKVENNTQLNLSSAIVHKVLFISNNLLVSEGSSLTFQKPNGVKIDVELANEAKVEIGGQVTIEKGVIDFNNATVVLHSNPQPLNRVDGQFSLGAGSSLQFGKEGVVAGNRISLVDNIFVGNPSIGSITINSAEGVEMGNQSLTIIENAEFVSGDLITNNQGYLKFAPQADLPTEKLNSKIVGFAEMLPRLIGYDSISFLGYSISTGNDNLGYVSILRSTGAANFSEDAESIAVTWDVNVDNQPERGRYVSMQWFEEFDNGINVENPLQMYRYTNGTEWEIVGGATHLASNENGMRTSSTILTDHFSEWTIGDGLNNALPVTLLSFSGTSSESGVFLNWATASELNNDKFIVERLVKGSFEFVGAVKGNGTSSSVSRYDFADLNPQAGTNYYRLTQVDYDGKKTSFETIAVEHAVNASFEVFPNPTSGDNLNINLAGDLEENAIVRLYNAKGTLLFNKVVAGNMSLNLLEGQNLTKGLYYLEFVNGGASEKRRVIVR